jgi:aminoglycoside phosphotransferase (APT) family kinase protein
MDAADADPRFREVARKISPGAELLRVRRLEGGVSAQVDAIEIGFPDGRGEKIVIRQYGDSKLRADPDAADHEFRLLEMVRSAGVPAPRPYLADASGQILPRPYLAIELVEGETVLDPPTDIPGVARPLAEVLARIHRVPRDGAPFLPDKQELFGRGLSETPATFDEALSEREIRAALARAWPPVPGNEPVLLHGDFWPGNTLWARGRLAAVIDWEDAGFGDPLADLANGRLEITMILGQETAREFTRHYRSLMPSADYTNLPQWDLCAALRPAGQMFTWGLDQVTFRKFQDGHRAFVRQALEALPT